MCSILRSKSDCVLVPSRGDDVGSACMQLTWCVQSFSVPLCAACHQLGWKRCLERLLDDAGVNNPAQQRRSKLQLLPARTCDACRDGWFAFDTVLVILMWFETWLLSLVQIFFGDISNSSSCFSACKRCWSSLVQSEGSGLGLVGAVAGNSRRAFFQASV